MSDLRDQIAAAIKARWRDMSMEETWDEGALLLADAVIAELGLIRDPFSTVAYCRYVTQWQPNDDFKPYCQRCGIPHTNKCLRPADA